MSDFFKRASLLAVFLLILSSLLVAEIRDERASSNGADGSYELTIYVIPSYRTIDWTSPATLIKSTVNSFMEASFNKNRYPIGHLFIELRNPADETIIRTSIASRRPSEQREMVLKDKIGLGMLGAPVEARMESKEELADKIDKFARKGKIAFISYSILPEAADRVIKYVEKFTSRDSLGKSPSDRYGGSFWPLFHNEGAGCSAFGMAALELTGVNIDNPEWYIRVNVPYDLVGGKYNNMTKVKPMDVLKRKEWHDGSGEKWRDYYTHFIYDPSYIYSWILKQLSATELPDGFERSTKKAPNGKIITGLSSDATGIKTPDGPIFKKRESPSVFIL